MNQLEIGNGDSNTAILFMYFGSKVVRLLNLHLDARETNIPLPKKIKAISNSKKGLGFFWGGGCLF